MAVDLPEELIEDILSRLPVKYLLRFRCVCKSWWALSTNPVFIKTHLTRSIASTNSDHRRIFFTGDRLYSINFDFHDSQQGEVVEIDHPLKSYCSVNLDRCKQQKPPIYKIQILGSCNGLLCIASSRTIAKVGQEKEIFLWNPSTGSEKKLPNPPPLPIKSFDTPPTIYGFGYDPANDDYKLVRIVRTGCKEYANEDDHKYERIVHPNTYNEVNVYSLSTNSWRRRGSDMLLFGFRDLSGVFACSALHWVAFSDSYFNIIVSFDLTNEEFGELPLPDFVDNKFNMIIGVLEGQLCMFCNFSMLVSDIWVMKDYGMKDSWVKQFSIAQPLVIRSNVRPLHYTQFIRLCYLKNEQGMHEPLILSDPCTGEIRDLRLRGVRCWGQTYISVGSLVSANAKDGTEQEKEKKQ